MHKNSITKFTEILFKSKNETLKVAILNLMGAIALHTDDGYRYFPSAATTPNQFQFIYCRLITQCLETIENNCGFRKRFYSLVDLMKRTDNPELRV